jgi:hypothetical protein
MDFVGLISAKAVKPDGMRDGDRTWRTRDARHVTYLTPKSALTFA